MWVVSNLAVISLACVSADDIVFYECLACNHPQTWMSQHVIPLTNKPPVRADLLSERLSQYLDQFIEIRHETHDRVAVRVRHALDRADGVAFHEAIEDLGLAVDRELVH